MKSADELFVLGFLHIIGAAALLGTGVAFFGVAFFMLTPSPAQPVDLAQCASSVGEEIRSREGLFRRTGTKAAGSGFLLHSCPKSLAMNVPTTATKPWSAVPQPTPVTCSRHEPGLAADTDPLGAAHRALVLLGRELHGLGYRFTTITPASHARVRARNAPMAITLADIFGWSRPFREHDLPSSMLTRLDQAGCLERSGSSLRSAVRFSTLEKQIFVHSAFPTEQPDAVFFGPDTYRFARAVRNSLHTFASCNRPGLRLLDVGAGSGVGGLYTSQLLRRSSPRSVLTDINERALHFCRINTALNDVPDVETVESDLFSRIDSAFDLIISNPPYLVDPLKRQYRHGGGELGSALSVRIVDEGIERLAPGGRLILYTGSAIVDGDDALYDALRARLAGRGTRFTYEEIDPDVFGEELEHPPYDRAERIAAVVAVIDSP